MRNAASTMIVCLSVAAVIARGPSAACAEKPYGLAKRVPWVTSRVKGSPDPPLPFRLEIAFPQLQFKRPVVITNAPGTDRLFLAELDGRLFSFPNDPQCGKPDLFLDLRKAVPDSGSVYGLTFHPQFAESRYVYVCYVMRQSGPEGTRVVRFEVTRTDPPRIMAGTERIVITWVGGGHNGGCLKFGPDGMLYIATGDATGPFPPDTLDTGQDIGDLLSSILRIDVDHAAPGKTYAVPRDNPFVDRDGARPEVWAYGFRNPWKMSFDPVTGYLWTGDVGWELWEMVFRVERGGNYGWSVVEGPQAVHPNGRVGPTPILPPVASHPHTESASISGGFVYRGQRLPELVGAYIYGDYVSGKLWGLRYDGTNVTAQRELVDTPLQIIAFGEDNAGELYVMDYERTGRIYRLARNSAARTQSDFPRTLSETGLFASVEAHQPAAGVIPYSVNAPLWSDGATAERFLAVPGDGRIRVEKNGTWTVPAGTVAVKTLSMGTRRLETQLLHFEDASWRAYTYVWNDAQTNATLAGAEGLVHHVTLADPAAPGGQRSLPWRVAGRAQCLLCHNPQAGNLLGVNTRQMNRTHDYGQTADNQLRAYQHAGLFASKLPKPPERLPRLVAPHDETTELNHRARSYLHANCAHCHRNGGGGTATILLDAAQQRSKTATVNVAPAQGTFDIADARIITPGDPYASVLYYRMAKLGHGHMPRIGSEQVDTRAVRLIHDWIAQMPTPTGGDRPAPHQERAAALAALGDGADAIGRLTASTRSALVLARVLEDGALPAAVRRDVIERAGTHARHEVRDLFERFLPAERRTRRLGTVIDPARILSRSGDPGQGKESFFNPATSVCASCHRVQGTGGTVGPDLSKIGQKYKRAELLEHILNSSKKIEPQYAAYSVQTADGRILTGVISKRTARELVIQTAQGESISLPADQVERIAPQQKSLMPDELLRDMTAQQAADLLAFLSALR